VAAKEKIVDALFRALKPEYVRLDDDDGISGIVVSRLFEDMSALDRQTKIDEVLSAAPLSQDERRKVLMIAGVTPAEFETVGARIRVHKIRQMANGAVEVLLHGGSSDAGYVRDALNNQKGIRTTEPKPVIGAPGVLMSFRAKGPSASPLTRAKALQILKSDPYIEVMSNA